MPDTGHLNLRPSTRVRLRMFAHARNVSVEQAVQDLIELYDRFGRKPLPGGFGEDNKQRVRDIAQHEKLTFDQVITLLIDLGRQEKKSGSLPEIPVQREPGLTGGNP